MNKDIGQVVWRGSDTIVTGDVRNLPDKLSRIDINKLPPFHRAQAREDSQNIQSYQQRARKMNDIITINGIEYAPVQPRGNRAVIVVDRGWIFAGDVHEKDGRIYLTRAVWVFSWDSIGFAAVIENPAKADIRPIADVDVPLAAEIFRIPVSDDWGVKQ